MSDEFLVFRRNDFDGPHVCDWLSELSRHGLNPVAGLECMGGYEHGGDRRYIYDEPADWEDEAGVCIRLYRLTRRAALNPSEPELCATCWGTQTVWIKDDEWNMPGITAKRGKPCPDCTPEPSR